MSDYKLTTEEVRARFLEEPQYWVNVKGDDWVPEKTKKDFDLWLVQERKRVADMAIKKERKRMTQIFVGMKSDCTCEHCKRNNVYMDSLIDLIDGKTK